MIKDRKQVLDLGFKEIGHYTVANSLSYDIGRHRCLSIGSLGSPNEMMFICATSYTNPKKITDLVCIHNYDYDGFLTIEKIKKFIDCFI